MADFEVPAGTVVLETAMDYENLDRELKSGLPKRGEQAGKVAGEGFRRGFDKAVGDDAGRKVEKSLEGAEKGSRRAREAFEQTSAGAADMGEAMEGASESAGGLALLAGTRLVKGLRGLTGWVGRTTSSFLTLSGVGVRELGEGLSQMGRELAESDSRLRALGKGAEVAGSAIESLGGIMISVASAITGAKVAVAALAATMVIMAKRAEDRFRPAWNRVLTLIPDGTEGIRDLRHEVSELAADLGIEAPKALGTLYTVLSAMPELVERPAEALEVLRVALKVAATGFAEGETAARAITAILNAFNLEASEAERVSDALFAAQDQGVLTFGEIATEIGKVSNLTSSMNADFEDLLGILATITPSGENVSQTMTQIRSVLRELLDPTEQLNEALGGDAAGFVSDRGLLAALQRIAEVTEGDPQLISQMFGRGEAVQLVNSLAQNMDTLEEKTREVSEAAGETDDKLDQMTEAIEEQKKRARELWQHDLRLWGEGYERLAVQGLTAFNDMHAAFGELLDLVEDAKQAPFEIAAAYEATFHERIPRAISSTLRNLAGLPPLPSRIPARGGEGPLQLPPESETGAPPGLQRPEPPHPAAFAEDIEDFAAGRQLQAMLEFMETGDLRRYEAALRAIQLEVNDLVEAETQRLRSIGATGSELQPLLSLFDEEAEKYRNLKLELEPLKDAYEDWLEAVSKLPDVVGPDVEGFREGAGGMLEVDPDQAQKLAQLQRLTEEFADSQMEGGEAALAIRQRMDDLDVSYEDLNQSIRMNIRATGMNALSLATLGFEVEGLNDVTSGLQKTFDEIEGTARGLLSVADAAGVLSDDLRQALQGAIDLAGALSDISAAGGISQASFGQLAQFAGGAIGFMQGLGQALNAGQAEREAAQRRLVQTTRDLQAAFEELVRSADAVAAVFGEVPGGTIGAAQEAFEGFEVPEGTSEDAAREQITAFHERRRAAGLSSEDLLELVEQLPGDFPSLTALLGGGGTIDPSTIGAEIEAFMRMLDELDLSRLTEGWDEAIDEIENRFQILDIDEPLDKLEAYRDAFLEFAELPAGLEEEIRGLDLSTAEGRARLEEIMVQLFEQMRAGELDPSALGELTAEQFEEAILDIEGLADQVAQGEGGGPGAESFQVISTIQEVTANEMVGYLSTMDVRLAHISHNTAEIAKAMGREGFGTPIHETGSAPLPAGVGGGRTVNVTQSIQQSFDTDVGPITVELEDGSEASAEELIDNVERHIDRKLGETFRRVTEDYGLPPEV